MSFKKDIKLQESAGYDAENAVNFALSNFNIKLDWSDDSIENVEIILGKLHKQSKKDKPTSDEIFGIARPFGSYMGEVYRRNHGAEWGLVTIDGETLPGLSCPKNGLFWPWGKAQNRIENGEEDNVWQYYQILIGIPPQNLFTQTAKKSLWKRLIGL